MNDEIVITLPAGNIVGGRFTAGFNSGLYNGKRRSEAAIQETGGPQTWSVQCRRLESGFQIF
ncbi:MAG: hypothetical protein KAJ98_08035, partial [Spirochaetaceae bacterium]|nr:hypothetical protein [Spirochaetaceae bacterium]